MNFEYQRRWVEYQWVGLEPKGEGGGGERQKEQGEEGRKRNGRIGEEEGGRDGRSLVHQCLLG